MLFAKKSQFVTIIISAILTVSLLSGSLICFAGNDDEVFNGAALETVIAPDAFEENAYGLRGFAASPDGKRLFLGYLHGPYGDEAHISVHDAGTFEKITEFAPVVDQDIPVDKGNYYAKGLAVDNRGFLFAGVTHAETKYCSIYCYDNYYREIGHVVEEFDDITGINGVAVHRSGDRILLYVLTCYHVDTIRCYDVTDPTNMKLYDGFGEGGVVDYNELTGSERDPGYVAVDVEGNVYITCLLKDNGPAKGSHVLKLSPDGKTIAARAAVNEAYGICTAGDYLFVSTYNGADSKVLVLNRSDLSEVASMSSGDQEDPLTSIAYSGQYLFVADQGYEQLDDSGRVLRSDKALNVTRDPKETEKVDPGEYETPPTAVPTQEPEDSEGSVLKHLNYPLIVILALCAVAAIAAVIIILSRRKSKKQK